MDFYNISTKELEHIIEEYPWYNLARKAYIQKSANGDSDKILSFVKESSLFVQSRINFLKAVKGEIGSDFSKEPSEKPIDVPVNVQEEIQKPRQYIVGGDYFGKEDFQQLSSEGLSVNVEFSLPAKGNSEGEYREDVLSDNSNEGLALNQDMFYTETLAEIYANQELYSQAIEIYNKLILLYPEKNAYFASLIENIKNKIN